MSDLSFEDFIREITEEDPGALYIIDLMLSADRPRMVRAMLLMEDLGLSGDSIWRYYYQCGANITKMFEALEARKSLVSLGK